MSSIRARKLGKLVAKARARKGYSTRQLAELTGLDYSWISYLEQGRFQQPAPDRLARLADVLELDGEELDRLSGEAFSSRLPGIRAYLRVKYDLPEPAALEVEQLVAELHQQMERGEDGRSKDQERGSAGSGRGA